MPDCSAILDAALGGDAVAMVWRRLRHEAEAAAAEEPLLTAYLQQAVLAPSSLADALGVVLADKLADANLHPVALGRLFGQIIEDEPAITRAAAADLIAVCARDPASGDHLTPFLYFKGFQALQAYRFGHRLWQTGRTALARYLQSRIAERFAVDIHPAARIGCGVFLDHATGIVIGETAVVEDDVSMLQNVTLGGTGKETGDRHPKIRRGVLIGAGAKILGNIEIGEGAKVGAGSVVLRDVPPRTTVAGVPARVIGSTADGPPAFSMDQLFAEPNYSI